MYVDYDPVVLAHARALLTSSPQGATGYIDADLRDTGSILDQAAETLDFAQPVAVLLFSIMQVIGDDDNPYGIVARLIDAVPPGSYLALSHPSSDIIAREKASKLIGILKPLMPQKATLRGHAEVARFFDVLELVEPGLVPVEDWRPDSKTKAKSPSGIWGGVGRKR